MYNSDSPADTVKRLIPQLTRHELRQVAKLIEIYKQKSFAGKEEGKSRIVWEGIRKAGADKNIPRISSATVELVWKSSSGDRFYDASVVAYDWSVEAFKCNDKLDMGLLWKKLGELIIFELEEKSIPINFTTLANMLYYVNSILNNKFPGYGNFFPLVLDKWKQGNNNV